MPKFSAADIAQLPAHIRQQIEAESDKPQMDVKERARQQWKPRQGQEAAQAERNENRALSPRQRRIRLLTASLRQAHGWLDDATLARYALVTGCDDVLQAKRRLREAIERLEGIE